VTHVAPIPFWDERNEPHARGVLEPATDLCFVLEHRPAAETARVLRQRNLQGHRPACVLEVRGLEHHGHASPPDLLEDDEAAFERLTGFDLERGRHDSGESVNASSMRRRALAFYRRLRKDGIKISCRRSRAAAGERAPLGRRTNRFHSIPITCLVVQARRPRSKRDAGSTEQRWNDLSGFRASRPRSAGAQMDRRADRLVNS
jgi:hypothetical protein